MASLLTFQSLNLLVVPGYPNYSSLSKFYHSNNTEYLFFIDASSKSLPSSDTCGSNMLNISSSSHAPAEPAPVVEPTLIPTSTPETTLCRSTRT